VSRYPVSEELRALGFEWFDPQDLPAFTTWLTSGDDGLIDRNRKVVEATLSLDVMQAALAHLLHEAGWLP